MLSTLQHRRLQIGENKCFYELFYIKIDLRRDLSILGDYKCFTNFVESGGGSSKRRTLLDHKNECVCTM